MLMTPVLGKRITSKVVKNASRDRPRSEKNLTIRYHARAEQAVLALGLDPCFDCALVGI
jgi:hypothetical protein